MDEARALLLDGHHGPLWVVADEQTGGRGRHGRQWSSPPGNLYATLALTEPCEPGRGPELGFVAGVALHRMVEAVTGVAHPALALKWPNDLLLDRAKCAGLLLEGLQVRGAFCVLIGFGVNVVSAPEGMAYPTTCLFPSEQLPRDPSPLPSPARGEGDFKSSPLSQESALGSKVDLSKRDSQPPPLPLRERVRERGLTAAGNHAHGQLNALLCALSSQWLQTCDLWRAGFPAIRAEWLTRAAFIGERITVRPPSGEVSGVMCGIDDTGRLLVEREGRVIAIDAGDLMPPQAQV